MESKKLQQLQQANSHLAPQPMPQKRPPPPFHSGAGEFRHASSPVFQKPPQFRSMSNFTQINLEGQHNPIPSSMHMPPMDSTGNIHSKQTVRNIYQQPPCSSQYPNEQLYQSSSQERSYQMQPHRSHYSSLMHSHPHPVQSLQQQYQQLQQAKLQQQIQTQNEALVQQQRTFALRQQLNPPIPQSHFHMQNPIVLPTTVQPQLQQPTQQQSAHRNAPPSTLNLSSQFQPAAGPIKMTNSEMINPHYHQDMHNQHLIQAQNAQTRAIYHQNQQKQLLKSKMETVTPAEQGPVYIQQNHPGHVVNQACQTQISGGIGNKTKSPTDDSKSHSHQMLDRKKSTGTMHSLKSPITKRPASSPVTISGWLYKQGSDGLKVWRKRWFVLSEYCLYYYKGPEEEKLLGSILLPSYRVAACSIEDKIYRKYAFKCEHTNMRTYWLAAENSETMGQWIRALTAATMMQGSSESSDQASQPSVSSLNHSGENSDSGIHTFQSQQSKMSVPQGPVTPASDSGGGVQPLYANAPPKPRRVNDGGYSSPSPENSIERCDTTNESSRHHLASSQHTKCSEIISPGVQQPQLPVHQSIYDTRMSSASSTLKMGQMPPNTENLASQFHQMHFDQTAIPISSAQSRSKSPYHVNEYLKSPSSMQKHKIVDNNNQRTVDLEQHIIRAPQRFNDEMYGERELNMQRAVSQKYPMPALGMNYPNVERRTPDAYGRSKSGQPRPFSDYEDIYNLAQQQQMQQNHRDLSGYRRPLSPPTYDNTKRVPSMPSRYTANQSETASQHNISLRNNPLQYPAITRPHSADFLEYEARSDLEANIKENPIRTPRPKSSLDINRNPDSYYYSEASYAEKMRQSALYLQKPQNSSQNQSSNSPYCGPDSSPYSSNSNTIAHESQFDRMKRIEMLTDGSNQGALSVPRIHRGNLKNNRAQQNEQFLRSASARLPRKEDESALRDGERKREESMKRLLEWKQRMLQSPLTRKSSQQSNVSISKLASNSNISQPHGIQRSRSDTHANASGYNSYSSDDEASISIRNVSNIPKMKLTVLPDLSDRKENIQNNKTNAYYTTNIDPKYVSRNFYSTAPDIHEKNLYSPLRKSGSRAEIDLLERETSSQIRNLDMSAGDLLSRTHEELVLLLIQLRRQNSTTARAIEQCCTDIHELQNRIRTSDGQTKGNNIMRLDYLKQNLLDLEKQYEKSKPLVNLVDNMVKLGSLYRSNETTKQSQHYTEAATLDRLEFNQKVQERRLLQEEQKHWDRLSPDHTQLQSKVRELYQLDQLLQEESGTLQSLQRDKEDLERALGGLRARLQDTSGPPLALEAAKKQQHTLERELSRVHQLLAEHSKKLEQTVAGNARLEQELLILRQKLQASRAPRGSQGVLAAGDSIQYASSTTALLESELRRVQQLVGDMQRQRQELSQAVRQLTENSNKLYQQIGTKDHFNSSHIKKRLSSTCWTETDLDSMVSVDHSTSLSSENLNLSTPLYIDTSSANSSSDLLNCSTSSKICEFDLKNMRSYGYTDPESIGIESDEFLDNSAFANLTNQEKQEIKTVRIVKRESERRHRDRDRSVNTTAISSQNLDQVLEEDSRNLPSQEENGYSRSRSLPRSYNETYEPIAQINNCKSHEPSKYISLSSSSFAFASNPSIPIKYTEYFTNASNPYLVSMTNMKKIHADDNMFLNNNEHPSGLRHKTESIQSLTKSITDLSPVFQSEAARQIIIQMSGSASEDNEKVSLAHKHKRSVPKEKRRHYTAPNNVNAKAMQNIHAENDMNRNNTNWRARDDLDMEVALRPRLNAPDVVRSALGHREKISENTIDKLLAAPSKILIPERYIPEQTPELSPEEKKRRHDKVEAIKKMLSEAPINSSKDIISLPPSKINAEKKQREHLLQLNQILAQQVMQMSKIVAEKAMATLPSKIAEMNITTLEDEHSSSPTDPLPIYQQRDNYFT